MNTLLKNTSPYTALSIIFFITAFSVKSFAQVCTGKPEGQITASPVYFYDAGADSLIITVPVKNTGNTAFASPFKITVYKNDIGDAKRYTYNYNSAIAAGETANITFGIEDFKAEWTPFDSIKIRINDSGNGYSSQDVCDSARRDYKSVQLIASDDRMLIFNNSADNQFRVALNDILPSSYQSLTVTLLNDPAYTGTATVSGSTVFYTPAAGESADTLRYRIHCGNAEYADTATIYIKMMDKVDNIGEAECYVTPQGNAWNIKLLKTSPVNYFAYGSPVLAGDLDSDNHVEIVLVDGSPNLGTKLAILDDNLNLKYTLTSSENFTTVTVSFSMANVDGGPNAAIFIATYDTRQLKKFTLNTVSQTYEEAWSVSYSSNVNYDVGNPLITDFNGDGYAEVSVYDKIFDAQTGTLLASGNYLGTNTTSTANSYKFGMRAGHPTVGATKAEQASIMAAGDIDGDGLPELVGGNCVYKVIINSRTNSALNSFTLLRQTNTTGHPEASDGPTSLADMDLDGKLDAVVTLVDINWYAYGLYIWNPRTGEVMHSNVINNLNPGNHSGSGGFGPSLAAVGNLDTDPVPEIAFIGMTVMYVYDYNPETKQLIQKWNMSVNDESAITLFDFNQDNKLELVYRDFTRLMVIEGETHTVLTSIACGSGTANEYPLILDVNNDGHAEFVIVAGANNALTGTVRIYGMETWAPARKVWNQYAYNSVNVNDDLTIPAVQMNPATVFPGPDGQLGTSDDIRPYNNFLQQQTTLSKTGTPYWEASDYALEGIPNAVYDEIGDFLDISFCVKNYGDVQGTPPFYVSVYQNARQAGNAVVTKSFSSIPASGQTECGYSIRIENVKATVSINSLHLWLNDSGNGTSANPECDYTNGVVVYDVTGTVNAQNDYASIFACEEIFIPILDNDEYSGTTFTVLNTPKYGTAVQSGGRLKYTHNTSGSSGLPCEQTGNRIDTVHYRIESIVSHAEAYATVKIYSTPEMILENACSTSPKIVLSSSYEGFTYKWEYSPDGASGWQVLSTDSSSTELNSVQEGFYRITVSYDSGKTYQLKKGIEVVANRTAVLPGGTVWYDMSFNPVNISWQ